MTGPDELPDLALIEVGGSRIRAARSDEHRMLARVDSPLSGPPAQRDLTQILDQVAAAAVVGSSVPERAIVAWPGPVSPSGTVWANPTVADGIAALDVAGELSRRWNGAKVHVLNEMTATALRVVAAEGLRDFAVLTVGSGIGHKVFIDGRAATGPEGRGGEIGHLLVDPSPTAALCSCGLRGHLGGIASGRAVVDAVVAAWRANGQGGELAEGADHGPAVVAAFHAKDELVNELVRARARLVGWALAALHLAVGIETFVVIGGFALAAGEPFRAEIVAGAVGATWSLGLDWDRAVRLGAADDDHGLVGARIVARDLGWLP